MATVKNKPCVFSPRLWSAAAVTIGVSLTAWPAHAQIVVDHAARSSEQPRIEHIAGVPVVEIRPPDADGLSHNVFTQFDVQREGVVLNNAVVDTHSALLGPLAANPHLSGGAAHTILNEVRSNDPSFLLGPIEVAGASASVLVANPSGLMCNGCGFIHAKDVMLLAGRWQTDGGFIAEHGVVRFEGAGMAAENVDYVGIMGRAVQIDAPITARSVDLFLGPNQLNVSSVAKMAFTLVNVPGDAPVRALDASELGGMFVDKIRILSTEVGVGVRYAGPIKVKGDVALVTEGPVQFSGSAVVGGAMHLGATSIDAKGFNLYAREAHITSLTLADFEGAKIGATNAIDVIAGQMLTDKAVITSPSIHVQTHEWSNRRGIVSQHKHAGAVASVDPNSTSGADFTAMVTGKWDNEEGFVFMDGDHDIKVGQLLNPEGVILMSVDPVLAAALAKTPPLPDLSATDPTTSDKIDPPIQQVGLSISHDDWRAYRRGINTSAQGEWIE